MAIRNTTQLIDILTTLFLFAVAVAALYMAQGYSGRARMWPTYVLGALVLFLCIHLFILLKDLIRPSTLDKLEKSE